MKQGEYVSHIVLSQAYIKDKIELSVKEYLILHIKTFRVFLTLCNFSFSVSSYDMLIISILNLKHTW